MNIQPFARYLANYGETEARALLAGSSLTANVHGRALESDDRWQGCLVVPAFDESLDTLQKQIDALAAKQVLLILVINAPQNAAPDALQRTQDLYNQITAAGYAYVIVVDRVSAPWRLNPKQGVGLARKIGTDLALALIEQGRIHSPWILQTDADVALPPTYKHFGVTLDRFKNHPGPKIETISFVCVCFSFCPESPRRESRSEINSDAQSKGQHAASHSTTLP